MINIVKLLPYATSVAVSLYLIKRYFGGGVCKCKTDLAGKVVIVTGGTAGVGKEVAILLAERGAKVVIASRDQTEHHSVPFEFLILNIEFLYLDLRSFSSIREFSKIIHDRFDSVYALVNNAGVFYQPFYWTEDGFEATFQTNYLGPFLLTHLLLDLIRASPVGGRVINVSCEAHRFLHELDPRYADKLGAYSGKPYVAYAASKTCLLLFTHKLSESLNDCGVTVNDSNPGNVHTNLLDHYFRVTYHPLLLKIQAPLRWLLLKTPRQGAQTTLHLILSPDLQTVTGKYFTNCVEREPSALCRNSKLAEFLWIQSLAWVNQPRPSSGRPEARRE